MAVSSIPICSQVLSPSVERISSDTWPVSSSALMTAIDSSGV
jgi:hypothetical protein